jgi:adenosylmethionine-8-amino-7-oxononanoate aminotransferase
MFAFQQAGIDPDIVCLGKALAAGYVPISATIVKDRIHATFGDSPDDHTLYHGHTFGGNPVAAAAAIETLGVFEDERILDQARETGRRISAALAPLAGWPGVREVRCLGAMGAVEFDDATRAAKAGNRLRAQRILVRPLGGVIYLMPPLNTPSADLDALLGAFCEAVGSAG